MVTTDGFVRLPNWLIDDADLTLHELAIYIVLLRFRDHKTGKCHPGMTTIADLARTSRETVKRTIPKLEAKGMIRVTKRKENGKNFPNIYDVALASESPEFVWATSKRGRRIPKRSGRHSECPPPEGGSKSRHSETPPRHSETRGVGTPSASNKTYKNKNQEQAVTPALPIGSDQFTFGSSEENATTASQLAYLEDLVIHLWNKPADEMQIARWTKLNRAEATQQIRGYLEALGRPYEHLYPQVGTKAYNALSPAGKAFAQSGGMPDAVA